MLSPLTIRLFKGAPTQKCLPLVRPSLRQPIRHYVTKKEFEEFQQQSEQLLKEAKLHTPPGIDLKSALAKESAEYTSHYEKFYNEVAGPGKLTVSDYPADFYKKSELDQKVYRDYHSKIEQFLLKAAEKNQNDLTPGISRLVAVLESSKSPITEPVTVCITGAAGAIGYALAYRIASGGLFGPKTPVILNLLELPQALKALKGVEMELLDCAFPTLKKVNITDSATKAFENVDYAILVGAQPRTKGMERGDLLLKNAEIFATQGKALDSVAKGESTRVVVVGNPANTNALIASHHAKSIPKSNFIAMTRLDHNRALAKLAEKTKTPLSSISRVIIWGNHSATQFPDLGHAFIDEKLALDVLKDDAWYKNTFIPAVQQRGAEIIAARGASSAASAASSALDTVFDWHFGTYSQWMSAAVHSNGEYGVTKGLYYSYPVVFNSERSWGIVRDLPIDQFSAEKMEATHKELLAERDGVTKFLGLN